tara:strand:- start:388 stop:1767 length:1380 start_codon:yes stop_codon:yes gene_type:complete
MKKTLLALAVAAMSANAFAVVDFDAASPAVPKFASEIKFDATNGTALTNAANILDATTKVGFSISANNQRYVRFDITGAEFNSAAIVAADLSAVSTSFVSTVSSTGKTFVIFEIKDTASAIAASDVLTFAPRVLAKAGNTVNLTYKLFETAVAAVANDAAQALYSKSNNIATYTPALAAKFTATTPLNIDVTAESKKFVGGATSTTVGQLAISPTGALWTDGLPAAMTDLVAVGSKVEISADMSAGKKAAADATKLDVTALKLNNVDATAIDASKATFNLITAIGDVTTDPVTTVAVEYTVDGTTSIAETTFTGKYLVTAAADSTAQDLPIGTLSELKKNGATAEVDLALKPGGAYSNFVRISNKSGLSGNFFVKVIADDGKSATVALSDVAGQSASIAAGASTTQMSIQQIFDAAAAKGLALSGEGKLRLVVEGQVPAGKINVQTYTVSKDGNSFATF